MRIFGFTINKTVISLVMRMVVSFKVTVRSIGSVNNDYILRDTFYTTPQADMFDLQPFALMRPAQLKIS